MQAPLVILSLPRLVLAEIENYVQNRDEETFEAFVGLVHATDNVLRLLAGRTLVQDGNLKKKLSQECLVTKCAVEDKLIKLMVRKGSSELLTTMVKTRQAQVELIEEMGCMLANANTWNVFRSSRNRGRAVFGNHSGGQSNCGGVLDRRQSIPSIAQTSPKRLRQILRRESLHRVFVADGAISRLVARNVVFLRSPCAENRRKRKPTARRIQHGGLGQLDATGKKYTTKPSQPMTISPRQNRSLMVASDCETVYYMVSRASSGSLLNDVPSEDIGDSFLLVDAELSLSTSTTTNSDGSGVPIYRRMKKNQ